MNTPEHHIGTDCSTVVVLNPAAGGGSAVQKWTRISEAVRTRLGEMKLVVLGREKGWLPAIETFETAGYDRVVAAGGDGTVNAVVQVLMAAHRVGRVPRLGAVALGSSNDYHKPVRADQQIEGVSCKIDFDRVQKRDVGVLGFEDDQGRWEIRHWIVNAGLGITADANDFFNAPNVVLQVLKRHSSAAAILYAALRTLLHSRSESRRLKIASHPSIFVDVTNLGVVKSPHFSGGFSYDSRFDPTNGGFHVHLCENMSLPMTLYTLWQLSRSRFSELPHTKSWQADRVLVTAKEPFAIEFDGEVIRSRKAAFCIADRQLEVCI